MLHGQRRYQEEEEDPRKGTWDEATESDSEDECDRVASKKGTKKKKEVPKE